MSDLKRLFLLDGMALVYRAHFAFIRNPRMTSTGVNTSAVFGYMNTLLDILNNQEPSHIAVAFDTSDPTRRHEEFPEYKAQRQEMPDDLSAALPWIFKLTEAMNIPILRYPGYEADDIIGTLARKAADDGFNVFMVTPDKDFTQLVCDRVKMYKPERDGVAILGVQEVLDKWKIERVDQVIDILGLMGDTSDNVPGVPGIGEKTAQKLLAKFDSIEGILAHTDQLKGKQKERLIEHAEQARLSRRLVTIDIDVPVEEDWDCMQLEKPNQEAVTELFSQLEFMGLGKRMFGETFSAGTPAAATLPGQPDLFETAAAELQSIDDVSHDYRLIETAAERQKLIEQLAGCERFCFDIETTSKDPRACCIVGIAFSSQKHQGAYVAFPAEREAQDPILEEFRELLTRPDITKVGHNLKYDLTVLRRHGIEVAGPLVDTMLASYLIDPETKHNMDYLAQRYLGYDPVPITQLIGEKKSQQLSMQTIDPQKVANYACEDADVTLQLWEVLEPELAKLNATDVFHDIEMPLVPVLVDMQVTGINLDIEALNAFSDQLAQELEELETRICDLAGCRFNLDSPKQLGDILFDGLKLDPKAKRTKKTKQYSTTEQVLQRLAGKHEIVQKILDYRQLQKLRSTYVDTLPKAVDPETGRVHTTYNQAVAATGRIQSSGPNLQNIPIRTERGREIRKAFIANGNGWKLLSADYSQIELRVIAHISGDAGLIEAFRSGVDIHQATAARVYHVELDEVTPEMRSKAKMVNYGVAYGMSAWGLAQRLNITNSEAGDIMKEYFRQFPGVKDYMDETIKIARQQSFVETLMGRRRYLRTINDSNYTMRSAAERNAINAPIQGSAADMIKIAMIRIWQRFRQENLRSKMLLQVHDELVFDIWLDEKEQAVDIVKGEMESALDLQVPLIVDFGFGEDWLTAH